MDWVRKGTDDPGPRWPHCRMLTQLPTGVPGLPRAVLGVLLAAQLAACASAPANRDQPAGVRVPAAWSVADPVVAVAGPATPAALADWWLQFDDPLLADLVGRALRSNTTVNGAQAALLQAQALRDVAAAGLWPTLTASASAQQGTSGGHGTGKLFQAGADANWVVDVFGARRHGLTASESVAAASAASLGDVQVQVAAEAALDYILLRSAQSRLAIANDNLDSQAETLQITLWREQAGLVTSLESEQARAASSSTRAQVPALQTAVNQAAHALAVLVGEPPAALDALVARPQAVPQAREGMAVRIPAETLRQRADVRAAEHQFAAALARVQQARANRWPGFAIAGSLGTSASSTAALAERASVLTSVLASISLPLFDGGALRATVRAQRAAAEQSRQAWRAAVLGALQEVEDALVALRNDQQQLGDLGDAAGAAARAALLARQRYGSGLVDFQVVLETQRTQFNAQDSLASATALYSSHVRLYRALGGGWSAP